MNGNLPASPARDGSRPGEEHQARDQENDREIEVLFGRIKAIQLSARHEQHVREEEQRARTREVEALEDQIERLLRTAKERDDQVRALENRITELLNSTSWQMTTPLRLAKAVVSRVVNRLKPLPAVSGNEATCPDRGRPDKEANRRVNIIIPVYNNLRGTKHCIESVLASLEENDCEGTMIVVNDGSTEEGVCEYLREIAGGGCMVLHNRRNLGFVKTVNRGINNTRPQDDVVLLNTDTEVNGDWLNRLQRCAYYDENIGTVTPFSNNAESCSFPSIFHDNRLPADATAAAIDAVFSHISGYDPIDLPSAVGFCMYIKRDCLDDVGLFDDFLYGRGYGEENEFSLRAIRKGWRNVLCHNVFVFHEGGGSFGAEKEERLKYAIKLVTARWPHYVQEVEDYRITDPAKEIRIRAMLSLLKSSDKPVILHLTHGRGGGTDKHVFDLIEFLGDRAFGIVAQPSGPDACALVLDGRKQTLTLRFSHERRRELVRFLASHRVGRVHVHQGWSVPEWMLDLPKFLRVPYDLTTHDFFWINGNPHLIDENGFFCEDKETRDERCSIDEYPVPEGLPVELFRERKARLFNGADRVLSPSQYTRDLLGGYFPDANYILADHHDRELGGSYPPVVVRPTYRDEKMRIAVLGALGSHKGPDVLDYVAMMTEAECEFHLIGIAYRPLDAAILQSGEYSEEDLPALIDEADPVLIWYPAIWPETYSYTLTAGLYSGRPIVAPDIGSFPERTRNRPYTYIEPWNKPMPDWVGFFKTLKAAFETETLRALPWRDQPRFAFRYGRDYLTDYHPRERIEGSSNG